MNKSEIIDLIATAVILAAVLIGGYYYLSYKRDNPTPVKVVELQVPAGTYKENVKGVDKSSFEVAVKTTE
jgi:hypothetical protein